MTVYVWIAANGEYWGALLAVRAWVDMPPFVGGQREVEWRTWIMNEVTDRG